MKSFLPILLIISIVLSQSVFAINQTNNTHINNSISSLQCQYKVLIDSQENTDICKQFRTVELQEYSNICKTFQQVETDKDSSDCIKTGIVKTELVPTVTDKSTGASYDNPVSIQNIHSAGPPAGVGMTTSFDAVNNAPVKVNVTIKYTLSHSGGSVWASEKSLQLDAMSKETITNFVGMGWGTSTVSDFNIVYISNDYSNASIQTRNIEGCLQYAKVKENICIEYEKKTKEECAIYEKKKIEGCKQCLGKDCLDDGQKCSFDGDCGSNICNLQGFCGTKKIIDCQIGTKNCNNESCLTIGDKKEGDSFKCQFQCKYGFGENGICKNPSYIENLKIWFYIIPAILISLVFIMIFLNNSVKKI